MKLTQEIYRASLEAKRRRGNFIQYALITLLLVAFTVRFCIFYKATLSHLSPLVLLLSALTLVCAVMAAVNLLFYISDLKNVQDFEIYEATLSHPRYALGFQRGTRCFTADFETSDGEKRSVETASIWSSSILSSFYFGDYCNKKARIAYSKTEGKLIVLNKTD